jgi:hypothetical protein
VFNGDSTSLKDSINMSETTINENVGQGGDQVFKAENRLKLLRKVNAIEAE